MDAHKLLPSMNSVLANVLEHHTGEAPCRCSSNERNPPTITADGTGVVSYAVMVLLAELADRIGPRPESEGSVVGSSHRSGVLLVDPDRWWFTRPKVLRSVHGTAVPAARVPAGMRVLIEAHAYESCLCGGPPSRRRN